MLTNFGKKVRNYCIEKSVKQKDVAKALGVSSAYFSALQNGTQEIPFYFIKRIIEYLKLNAAQGEELAILAEKSKRIVKIDIRNCDEQSKTLAAIFSVFSSKLDQEQKNKIIDILLLKHREAQESKG